MLQATALVGFADDFADANNVEKVFLTGDFNAYSEEDPVQILRDAGYTSLESTVDRTRRPTTSTARRVARPHVRQRRGRADVTGVDIWTMNALRVAVLRVQPVQLQHPPALRQGPFRASDHNPEIVGLNVADDEPVATTVSATGGPVTFGTNWNAQVTVAPNTATGQVEVLNGTTSLGTATLTNGTASVAISGTALPVGTHTLTVKYAGDATHAASTSTFQVVVNKRTTTVSATSGSVTYGVNWAAQWPWLRTRPPGRWRSSMGRPPWVPPRSPTAPRTSRSTAPRCSPARTRSP